VGRFFIEALRLDSFWVGSLRVPQLASVAGVVVALVGLWWSMRRPPIEVPGAAAAAPATDTARGTRGRRRPG
jgi:prolipoprotein diacylglyceryltransferase